MIVSPGGGGGGPTPVFTLPLQNLTVQVGRNATFTCYVRHIQRYQVSLPCARAGIHIRGRRRAEIEEGREREPAAALGGRKQAALGYHSLRGRNCPSSIILVHGTSDVVLRVLRSSLLAKGGCCSGEGRRSNDIGLGLRSPLCPSSSHSIELLRGVIKVAARRRESGSWAAFSDFGQAFDVQFRVPLPSIFFPLFRVLPKRHVRYFDIQELIVRGRAEKKGLRHRPRDKLFVVRMHERLFRRISPRKRKVSSIWPPTFSDRESSWFR